MIRTPQSPSRLAPRPILRNPFLLIDHAPSPQHIVPGHDPLVMRRYPPAKPELEGIVVRLDVMPKE
jgi:hypothetical protein